MAVLPGAIEAIPESEKTWRTITKSERDWSVPPNLRDYQQFCRSFTWEDSRRELDGLPGGRGLNIAHEAVDRSASISPSAGSVRTAQRRISPSASYRS